MKKSVYVILNDVYHSTDTYLPVAKKMFGEEDYSVTITESIRDVVNLNTMPDMVVNFTIGSPDGEKRLDNNEQEILKNAVENGMGMLYIHAGMAVIEENTPIFTLAKGRFISHPEEHILVTTAVINGQNHSITNGIEPFSAMDEHYFCAIDILNTTPIICSVSSSGTTISGWVQEIKKGRVVSLAQGHTTEMLDKMMPLFKNSIKWIFNVE